MSKPKITRANNLVDIARREARILGGQTCVASYSNAIMELLVEIRDLLRKASGK